MKRTHTLPAILAAVSVASISAVSAAITITDSFHVRTENGGGTDGDPNTIERVGNNDFSGTLASGWSLNGGNTIAVYFGGEGIVDGSFSATFGGQALNVVSLGGVGNEHISAVGYLINPTVSTGDVAITSNRGTAAGNRQSFAFGILSLSNVGSVAGSDTRSGNGDLSYTIGSDGGFVMGGAVNNNFSGPAPTISGNPNTDLLAEDPDGNFSVRFAYGTATSGAFTDSYSGSLAASTLAFTAIPEPSIALLGSLGLLALLRRRR